jgi:hypothetical protein
METWIPKEMGMQYNKYWLVVLTILKNISPWEGLSHILWKTKNVPNHEPKYLEILKPEPQ